jgi:hypothetical protein
VKQLYIVTIDMGGEDSIYFTEMTTAQADQMRSLLRQSHEKYTITTIKRAPGFNPYGALMRDFAEFVDVRYR